MNPMLQLTVRSGVIAFAAALIMPLAPKRFRKAILIADLAVMFYLTLYRGCYDVRQINLLPFWSFRKWAAPDVRWQIYMNVFLFIPYGAVLKSLGTKRPVLTALLTSAAIEAAQFLFFLGMCETDDVINNTLGALVGCTVYKIAESVVQKVKGIVQRSEGE